jgi:hypothetical protein
LCLWVAGMIARTPGPSKRTRGPRGC